VSNILTAGGNQFDSLPRLEAYSNGVCWLHAIATCPYGDQCSFTGGHIPKGAPSNAQADEAVAALQPGVSAMVARNGPPPPRGSASSGGDEAEAEAAWEPNLLPCPRCDWGNPWPLGVAGRGKTVQGTRR